MKLHSIFQESRVKTEIESDDFVEIVHGLIETLADDLNRITPDEVVERIMQREREEASLLEDWVCLLHLRMPEVKNFCAAAALTEKPVGHPSAPDAKLRLIFIVLAPQEQNTLLLQTSAAIARLVESKPFASAIKSCKQPQRLIRLIEESGIEVKRNITAGDIMEPVEHSVEMDTPIAEAIDVLGRAPDEGVPVLDEKGHLLGEITTKEILLLGMPKYMDLLANPAMLNAFEPFESFFLREGKTLVRDICRRDFITVSPGDPIVQVTHKMITSNRRRVYVLVDGKVEGVIYRKSIVQRVMNR